MLYQIVQTSGFAAFHQFQQRLGIGKNVAAALDGGYEGAFEDCGGVRIFPYAPACDGFEPRAIGGGQTLEQSEEAFRDRSLQTKTMNVSFDRDLAQLHRMPYSIKRHQFGASGTGNQLLNQCW